MKHENPQRSNSEAFFHLFAHSENLYKRLLGPPKGVRDTGSVLEFHLIAEIQETYVRGNHRCFLGLPRYKCRVYLAALLSVALERTTLLP